MSHERSYLTPLPRCRCGKPATQELRNGVNASLGRFCESCGKAELRRIKAGHPPE